ncbi:3-oxosteroid 1-dehydrogenase [Kutzneria buriramensis]|uniref:3-oxosteroid 1-dehydrogenase n=1 Tax=Kutzneria buriramensis TaxID=1045776 RepID=A0A3E0H2R0_9PSEU|nr:3-oxosteroid 1-dehydrogenase [Kutzneria buriramensis]REH37170.1 3-oxosteroid 1-dehydrogenase [Kutzneria buriramensis]
MPEFDTVVVGSGAAGMTAALTAAARGLSAVVLEKADRFGGSTARSGGGIWIPNNEVIARDGVRDNADDARAYLASIVAGRSSAERQRAYLDHGPAMLSFVLANTPLRLRWVTGYSDYYPERPGGRPRGRSVEPRPFDGNRLGEDLRLLEKPYLPSPLPITQADYKWLTLIARNVRGPVRAARVGARGMIGRLRGQRLLTMGQALAAGLWVGLRQAGVTVELGTPMVSLLTEDDRVVGVVTPSGTYRARYGVLLASGGFENNAAMRSKWQDIGTEWTVGAAANEGDGILAGQELGADVDLMDDAWWGPSIPLNRGPYFCLSERTLPGCILVNGEGERFVNEAAPYVDAVHAMRDTGSVPAWLISDQRYRDRYVFAGIPPRRPLPGRWYKHGAVYKAESLAELAAAIGMPPAALRDTVATFNGYARTGKDLDFGRGDSAYDHYYGDPRVRPNPSLAELVKPPFYAVRIVPGDLGTKGGLCTDVSGRVLRPDGSVIHGLYAAGNASASVMGHTYAGPGATIGPAMTFGYLAALAMSAVKEQPGVH